PAWRPDKLPMNRNVHCDEYPFASTLQGASFAKGHYSLKAVNGNQNVTHGNRLGAFYRDYRVGTGNAFWVFIED
ncbi:NucA/NucB deoxyribonuclease domain-containing protein, partial [Bailinhaonella thermotolerans]|uniref:NucA/NucB deoxyribonuclease domain-containing protein n=1 Tax=Bailinhaonella thermotolerans TaxID=1070861 RepID=UPI001A90C52A